VWGAKKTAETISKMLNTKSKNNVLCVVMVVLAIVGSVEWRGVEALVSQTIKLEAPSFSVNRRVKMGDACYLSSGATKDNKRYDTCEFTCVREGVGGSASFVTPSTASATDQLCAAASYVDFPTGSQASNNPATCYAATSNLVTFKHETTKITVSLAPIGDKKEADIINKRGLQGYVFCRNDDGSSVVISPVIASALSNMKAIPAMVAGVVLSVFLVTSV